MFRTICDICKLIIEEQDEIKVFENIKSFLKYLNYALKHYKSNIFSKEGKTLQLIKAEISDLMNVISDTEPISKKICKKCILKLINSDNFIQLTKMIFEPSITNSIIKRKVFEVKKEDFTLPKTITMLPPLAVIENDLQIKLESIHGIGYKLFYHLNQLNEIITHLNSKVKLNDFFDIPFIIKNIYDIINLNTYGIGYLNSEFESMYEVINNEYGSLQLLQTDSKDEREIKEKIIILKDENYEGLINLRNIIKLYLSSFHLYLSFLLPFTSS